MCFEASFEVCKALCKCCFGKVCSKQSYYFSFDETSFLSPEGGTSKNGYIERFPSACSEFQYLRWIFLCFSLLWTPLYPGRLFRSLIDISADPLHFFYSPKGSYSVNVTFPLSWLGSVCWIRFVSISALNIFALKDMLVGAQQYFEGLDNAMQTQKPHWESVKACISFSCLIRFSHDSIFYMKRDCLLFSVNVKLFFAFFVMCEKAKYLYAWNCFQKRYRGPSYMYMRHRSFSSCPEAKDCWWWVPRHFWSISLDQHKMW